MNSKDGYLTRQDIWNEIWDKVDEKELDELARDVEAKVIRREKQWSSHWEICRFIEKEVGFIKGIHLIELGSGLGRNSLALAILGAEVTLVDNSQSVLQKAAYLFSRFGLKPGLINCDVLEVSSELYGKFDVFLSAGLAEHFVGRDRERIMKLHLNLVKGGGVIMVAANNFFCPQHALARLISKVILKRPPIAEVPFTRGELRKMAKTIGAREPEILGQNFATSLDGILRHMGYPINRIRLPDAHLPILDTYFGFTLLLAAKR